MPQRITRSRLMRQRAISTPPPICNSKGIPAFFIRTCDCAHPTACTSVDIQDIDWNEAMAMVPGPPGTFGTWRYIDKEHRIDEEGSWNACTPAGLGTGEATIIQCFGGPLFTFGNGSCTYLAFITQCQTTGPAEHGYSGTWTSSDTGLTYPISGSNCPDHF